MATVDFFDAFEYKWAQAGGNFDWQDDQYKLGWATVGSTPPTVEQFNRVLQISDEKANWLYGQLETVATAKGITLSGASLAGLQQVLDAYTPDASTTVVGVMRIATLAETAAGALATTAVSPAGLNSVLVGAVQLFAMATAPAGWLKANGAAVSRTTYAALFSKIGTTFGTGDGSTTFNLPDLRGEFLRGWDDGRGIDASRVFGSAQLDAQQAFTGNLGLRRLNDGNSLVGNSGVNGGFQFSLGSRGPSPRLVSATDSATLADDQVTFSNTAAGTRTATETRARNVALLACIKY